MYKGGSGIIQVNPEEDPKMAFDRFTAKSEIVGSPMRGSSGFLLRYKSTELVYKSTDIDTYGNPVMTILVKFVPVRTSRDHTEFVSEVKIQEDIYAKTKDEPLCPAVVFSDIFKNDHEILTTLKLDLNELPDSDEGPPDNVGVIAMEFMECEEMRTIILENPRDYSVACIMAAAFLLIDLAIKTEYTQGDFHFKNICFKRLPADAEFPYFLSHEPYLTPLRLLRPIIIDFGRARKIDIEMYPIHQMYNEYKFKQILGSICAQGCRDVEYNAILEEPTYYEWASGSTQEISTWISKITHLPNSHLFRDYMIKLDDLDPVSSPKFFTPSKGLPPVQTVVPVVKSFWSKPVKVVRKKHLPLVPLVFFKNASEYRKTTGPYTDCNPSPPEITFLNARFDGKNGIMDKMIIARQNSQERIEFSRVLGGKKRTNKSRKRLKIMT